MSKYTITDFIKDCKEKFDKNKADLLNKEKFTEAMLQDKKTRIRYDGETPQPNMPIWLIDEKGNQVPLMSGNHVMEDGTMLIVKQDGIIAEVQGKAPETNPPAGENTNPNEIMADDKTPITGAQAKTVIDSVIKETRFEMEKAFDEKLKLQKEEFDKVIKANDEKVAALAKEKTELEAKFTKQVELNKELFELVKKLGDEAAVPPAGSVTPDPKPIDMKEWRKKFLHA